MEETEIAMRGSGIGMLLTGDRLQKEMDLSLGQTGSIFPGQGVYRAGPWQFL